MGRRYKVTNESLMLRFFKHLVTKLGERNLVFNISKGRIGTKQANRVRTGRGLLINVRDPFLKLENHGYWMKDEKNLFLLIMKIKECIHAIAGNDIESFIIQTDLKPNEKDLQDQEEDVKKRNEALEKAKNV
jgi:hypothetical protein